MMPLDQLDKNKDEKGIHVFYTYERSRVSLVLPCVMIRGPNTLIDDYAPVRQSLSVAFGAHIS